MKRIGILVAGLLFSAFALCAQDNSSSTTTTNASGNATTTTTTQDNQATTTTPSSKADSQTKKAQANADANAADNHKDQAKEAGTKVAENRQKAFARLDDSAKILNELLGAPDKGIPDEVFKNAKCVAVIPSMVKGGFVFGAEHGRGVATCRTAKGWSAPAFFTMTGGSWGLQIGVEGVDLVMLIMNQRGMDNMLNANFNFGGDADVAAGPVGRDATASTDWKFKSEVLAYSRSRGIFAGLTLKGASIRQDDDSTRAVYGHMVNFRPLLTGQVAPPSDPSVHTFLATVRRDQHEVTATAH